LLHVVGSLLDLHSFPTRRSSDLEVNEAAADQPSVEIRRVAVIGAGVAGRSFALACASAGFDVVLEDVMPANLRKAEAHYADLTEDRKSTRLNSSHQIISYAVFCL